MQLEKRLAGVLSLLQREEGELAQEMEECPVSWEKMEEQVDKAVIRADGWGECCWEFE